MTKEEEARIREIIREEIKAAMPAVVSTTINVVGRTFPAIIREQKARVL